MWLLLILLALGFIVGSGLVLLRTAHHSLPQRPQQLEHHKHD